MAKYTVTLVIDVENSDLQDDISPLSAAKYVEDFLYDEGRTSWTYIVEDNETGKAYSVDAQDEAVKEINNPSTDVDLSLPTTLSKDKKILN